jgi:hypothetical protein
MFSAADIYRGRFSSLTVTESPAVLPIAFLMSARTGSL